LIFALSLSFKLTPPARSSTPHPFSFAAQKKAITRCDFISKRSEAAKRTPSRSAVEAHPSFVPFDGNKGCT
jgi:hypothetical protein